ncbi:phage terminase Nu1 subunit (DNA packaging protein) [Nitrobacteraceae bacterium AZCC 2161]
MATTAESAAHIFLTAARFHDLVAQGVITKAERGAYDLNKVREQYIRNIRKSAAGHSKDGADADDTVAAGYESEVI